MTSKFRGIVFFLLISFGLEAMGQEQKVAEVRFEGNDCTKETVLKRELTFNMDSFYNLTEISERLLTTENRLMNLNLFNLVESAINSSDSGYIITISLVEKWYLWPIPSIEFSDRNFNVWQGLDFDPERTNYGLYLFNYNLFGSNHSMKLSFIHGYNKRYGLHYAVPFLTANSNIGMQLTAEYKSQNEVWLTTVSDQLDFYKNGNNNLIKQAKIELGLNKRDQYFNTFYANLGMDYTELSDSVVQQSVNINYLLDNARVQKLYYLKLKAERDQRDNAYFAMKGYYLSAGLRLENYNASQTNNIKLELKAQRFMDLAPKVYAAFAAYGQWNSFKNAPYNNYKLLGYNQNLRGFEYYVVDGHSGLLTNAAIRYHLINKPKLKLNFIPFDNYSFLPINVYLEAFFDMGYVANNRNIAENRLTNQSLHSYGIGLNTLFYNDRLFRFEYSINSMNQDGFYIHFKTAI